MKFKTAEIKLITGSLNFILLISYPVILAKFLFSVTAAYYVL